MTTWARFQPGTNIVQEITTIDPAGRFHPDIEAEFFVCPDNVTPGSTETAGVWTIYVPPVPPTPTPPPVKIQMQFTPPEFESKMFELSELSAIRASADPGVIQALRLMDDPRLSEVDLTAASTIKFINYLGSLNLLTAPRVAQILAGTQAP